MSISDWVDQLTEQQTDWLFFLVELWISILDPTLKSGAVLLQLLLIQAESDGFSPQLEQLFIVE